MQTRSYIGEVIKMRNEYKVPFLIALVILVGLTASCATNIERLEQRRNVQGLIKALEHQDPEVRRRAAQALGSIGDPRAVRPLDAMLRGRVSVDAAKALGQIGGPRAAEALITALHFEEPNVRAAAAAALVEIGEPAVKPLVAKLTVEEVGELAAETLGQIGEPAVEPLIAALKEWTFSPHRRAAAMALGQVGEPAVEPLVALIEEGDTSVSSFAASALGQIGEPALEPLLAALKNPSAAARAADALGKMGDPRAVEPLIAALKDPDFPSNAAADALGQIGDLRAVEPLIAALENERYDRALLALVQIGRDDPSVLVPYLQDTSTVKVYRALIRLGDSATTSALVAALDAYGDEEMAQVYLNCGNDLLEAAAKRWAKEHGYMVMPSFGGGAGITWGSK